MVYVAHDKSKVEGFEQIEKMVESALKDEIVQLRQ